MRDEFGECDCKYLESENLGKPKNDRNDLRIIHLNIRGLLNKQDQLNRLIKDTDADIILLCQTWLTLIKESHIDLSTHKLTSKHRSDRIGGGVGILVHKKSKIKS